MKDHENIGLDSDSVSETSGVGASSEQAPERPWTWRQAVTWRRPSFLWGLFTVGDPGLYAMEGVQINIPRRAIRALVPRPVRQVFWWLVRAFGYLFVFAIAVDFASDFSASPRTTRTAAIALAVVAASVHPLVKRRLPWRRRANV